MRNLTAAEYADQLALPPVTLGRFVAALATAVILVPPAIVLAKIAEPFGFLAIPAAVGLAFVVAGAPAVLERSRSRWIVRNGMPAIGRIVSQRPPERVLGDLRRIRVGVQIELPSRGPTMAFAKLTVSDDPRSRDGLEGKRGTYYWHERYPTEAVPGEDMS